MSLTVFFEVKIQIPTDLTAEECTVDNAIQYAFRELEEMLGDQNIVTYADDTREVTRSSKMTVTDQTIGDDGMRSDGSVLVQDGDETLALNTLRVVAVRP